AQCYSKFEIQEENLLAKASVLTRPGTWSETQDRGSVEAADPPPVKATARISRRSELALRRSDSSYNAQAHERQKSSRGWSPGLSRREVALFRRPEMPRASGT